MKLYIKCMGQSRNDIRNDLDNKGDQLVEHLVKIILYRERGNLAHWCDELGSFIHKVPKLKSRNRFPDKQFMLYKITQIPIKLLKFYIKFGYFASCFSEVCKS